MLNIYNEIVCEMPNFLETGNVYYKSPKSKHNIQKLIEKRKLKGFIEPNVGNTATLVDVNSIILANKLSPWNSDFMKCDALHVSTKFLKENKLGLFGRSSDCMMLSFISDEDIYLFHLSVSSLNAGILNNLYSCKIDKNFLAIEGPCISSRYYYLEGDRILQSMSNFKELGYMSNTYYDKGKLHIDIRGIVRSELERNNIKILKNDQCTYSDITLGSNRRDGEKRHDNVMIIY